MEKYHKEHSIKLALRITVADIRFGLRGIEFEKAYNIILEAFEEVAKNGADVLSIESMGGKEVFDYSIIRVDLRGVMFSLSVLAAHDMRRLWKEIVKIAEKYNVVPGGDTACGFANSAMMLAGGLKDRMISHVLVAVVRAISASRSLITYEVGAKGPGKDCGYENVIIKAITGYPMAMEGKTSAVAHTSLVGNIIATTCDLWSNEQVENINLFGGTGPQVFLEILHYDTLLMNTALREGKARMLRDLLVLSNRNLDVQALILSPENAWKIGDTIVKNSKDEHLRSKAAIEKTIEVIEENMETIKLMGTYERKYLKILKRSLTRLPDNADALINEALPFYKSKIAEFNPKIYEL